MEERILIIEDDTPVADAIAYALRKEGFCVEIASDGRAGLDAARDIVPDLVILDVMLPFITGFDVCRAIRTESRTPIIMVTGRTDEVDRVVGLELGADDYVLKPFGMRELVARVKAVLRRSKDYRDSAIPEISRVGDLVVDTHRHLVRVGGKEVRLPLKEFNILRALVNHKDKVLPREQLLQTVWPEESFHSTRTLDVHIRWLREKIEDDPGCPKRIVTIRGVGYMFVTQGDDSTA